MSTITQELGSVLVNGDACEGTIADQYYALIHWLRPANDASAVAFKAVGVTSCARGAGVSTVALNLAMVAAKNCDQPVLLLDLSTAHSTFPARLGIYSDPGLHDALAGGPRPGENAAATPIRNLSLLAANRFGPGHALSVDGRRLGDMLQALKQEFGFIVVDLPTVESSLCFAASAALNGVLLVMEAERTSFEAAARAKRRLMQANATILGAILNKSR